MTAELALDDSGFETRAVSPFQEMGAYEALWTEPKTDVQIPIGTIFSPSG